MIRVLSLAAFATASACGGTTTESFTETSFEQVSDRTDEPQTLNDEILDLIDTPEPDPVEPEPTPVEPEPEPAPLVVTPMELTPSEPTPLELLTASIIDFNTRSDAIGIATLDITPIERVQAAGSAEFAGFLTVNAGIFDRFVSELELDLDFDADTIEATHGQFYRDDDFGGVTEYDGELRLIRGTIGESNINDLDIDVRGTLRNGDSRLRVSANLSGGFLGDNSEALIIRTPLFGGEDFTITLDGEENGLSDVIISALPVTD